MGRNATIKDLLTHSLFDMWILSIRARSNPSMNSMARNKRTFSRCNCHRNDVIVFRKISKLVLVSLIFKIRGPYFEVVSVLVQE